MKKTSQIIQNWSATLTFLKRMFRRNVSPSSSDGSWIATDWYTPGTWCFWKWIIYLWNFMLYWGNRLQFSYHLLRMEKGFSEIFGSKTWVLISFRYLWSYYYSFCPVFNPCNSNPCRNGGTCTTSGTNYICTCTSQFSGPTCDQVLGKFFTSSCLYKHDCWNNVGRVFQRPFFVLPEP